ncbi:MAG: hypothetical protein WAZ94_13475 [Phycisphaerales bacterium]
MDHERGRAAGGVPGKLRTAAAALHARALRRAAEENPHRDDPSHLARSYSPCPACKGKAGLACEACDGLGHVRTDLAREELEVGVLASVGEFLRARAVLVEFGPAALAEAWGEIDPWFWLAMEEFGVAWAEAEHGARVAEAKEQRRRRAAKRR